MVNGLEPPASGPADRCKAKASDNRCVGYLPLVASLLVNECLDEGIDLRDARAHHTHLESSEAEGTPRLLRVQVVAYHLSLVGRVVDGAQHVGPVLVAALLRLQKRGLNGDDDLKVDQLDALDVGVHAEREKVALLPELQLRYAK